jgi:hypothetical protein
MYFFRVMNLLGVGWQFSDLSYSFDSFHYVCNDQGDEGDLKPVGYLIRLLRRSFELPFWKAATYMKGRMKRPVVLRCAAGEAIGDLVYTCSIEHSAPFTAYIPHSARLQRTVATHPCLLDAMFLHTLVRAKWGIKNSPGHHLGGLAVIRFLVVRAVGMEFFILRLGSNCGTSPFLPWERNTSSVPCDWVSNILKATCHLWSNKYSR